PAVELDALADAGREAQMLAEDRAAERTRHCDRIADAGAAPADRREAARLPEKRDVDRELPRVAGDVAADDGRVEFSGRPLEAREQTLDPRLASVPRDHH